MQPESTTERRDGLVPESEAHGFQFKKGQFPPPLQSVQQRLTHVTLLSGYNRFS